MNTPLHCSPPYSGGNANATPIGSRRSLYSRAAPQDEESLTNRQARHQLVRAKAELDRLIEEVMTINQHDINENPRSQEAVEGIATAKAAKPALKALARKIISLDEDIRDKISDNRSLIRRSERDDRDLEKLEKSISNLRIKELTRDADRADHFINFLEEVYKARKEKALE